MATFMSIITKATDELNDDFEADRSNHFLKYILNKKKKNRTDYDALMDDETI